MAYSRVYPNRINWQNTPSTSTPLAENNLNKMDYALYQHDSALQTLDTTKADKSDVNTIRNTVTSLSTTKADKSDVNNKYSTLDNKINSRYNELNTYKAEKTQVLRALNTVAYNPTNGIITFTWFNGDTYTIDLNVEKIPVSFSMTDTGVLIMRTQDGTEYRVNLGSIIKIYSFLSSDTIRFAINIGEDDTTSITAHIINGSITAEKLQPNYLADITEQAGIAGTAAQAASEDAQSANTDALLAKSYTEGGTGIRPGEDTDNAKYYKEQAKAIVDSKGHTIIDSLGNVAHARGSLQFENGQITDDSTNDITKVAVSMVITDVDWLQIEELLAYRNNETTYDLLIPDDDWSDVETILV